MSVYLIAEIGPNHNGSVTNALELIRQLADTGVDAVKFQLAVPENVYSRDAFKADYQVTNDGPGSAIEMSRRLQLTFADHKKLHAECVRRGVAYLCTAFDLESLTFLDRSFDLPYFKVASGEIMTIDMLEYMAERQRPILLSTGMSDFDEIATALSILDTGGQKDVTILHCVSTYPAPHAAINLNVIEGLKKRFGRPVGYSDHSLGSECCLGAVVLGACVLEKHVTLDRTLPGPDHKASATVPEMKALVASVRNLSAALGEYRKVFAAEEHQVRRVARKSIVAKRDIEAGEVISRADICFKRPGTGFSPAALDQVVGQRAAERIEGDRVILANQIAKS